MRASLLLSATATLALVVASPLHIFSLPTHNVYRPEEKMIERRQGFLDPLESAFSSAFGLTSDDSDPSTDPGPSPSPSPSPSPTPANSVQVGEPVAQTTKSSSNIKSATPSPTPSSAPSSTSTDSSTTSTSSSSLPPTTAAPTSAASSTPPAPVPTPNLGSSAQSGSSSSSGGGISGAGIAVAVIFPLAILILAAWLVFRYNPRTRAWWLARQERLAKDRSYRDAIDGPNANSLRSQALGAGPNSRRSVLQSFFQPSTVKLGGGKEIRRKPVNWGADSTAPPTPTLDKERISALNQSLTALPSSNAPTTRSSPVITEKPLPAARPKSHFDVIEMPANEVAFSDKTSIISSAAPMGRRGSQNTLHSVRTQASELPTYEHRSAPSTDHTPVSPVSHLSRHQSIALSASSAISPMASPRVPATTIASATGLGIAGVGTGTIPKHIPPMPQLSQSPSQRAPTNSVPRALDANRLRAAQSRSPAGSANSSGESLAIAGQHSPVPQLHYAQQVQAVSVAARPTMTTVKPAARGNDGVYRLG